jgi:hypothetical protein
MKKLFTILLSLAALPVFAQQPSVKITEILYKSTAHNVPSGAADSLEYIELYNASPNTVNLQGWTISNAIVDTLPSFTLAPGARFVTTKNQHLFMQVFHRPAHEWFSGKLDNQGETIVLNNAQGQFVDSVAYLPTAPWPDFVALRGSSINLCNVNSNNDVATNWSKSDTIAGFFMGGVPTDTIYGTPGKACIDTPIGNPQEIYIIGGKANMTLYPTLAKAGQNISLIVDQTASYSILAITGAEIMNGKLVSGTNTLVAPQTAGAYVVRMQQANGNTATKTLIIE